MTGSYLGSLQDLHHRQTDRLDYQTSWGRSLPTLGEAAKTLKRDRSIPYPTTQDHLNIRHNAEGCLGGTRICSVSGQAGQRPYSLESRETTMQLTGKNDSSSNVTALVRSLLEGQAPIGRVLWAVPGGTNSQNIDHEHPSSHLLSRCRSFY
ncbi:hypothetical protein EDD85DRAFT_98473 [Armillaria nabsnona]|nr:hypothetical protein EDD85DRAFT_98473 [Armillaria nabsnona]